MKITKKCITCGKEFTTYSSQNYKCCSQKCAYEHKRNGKIIKCKNCNKEFYVKLSHQSQQYCCWECFLLKTSHKVCEPRFHRIWRGMKFRCSDKKNKKYGSRGITVYKRWLEFINFYNDMYENYKEHCNKYGEKQTSIDRINNDGNYCKENCRWATVKEQALNQRFNRFLTYKKQTLTISQWTEKLNINYNTIYGRFTRGCTVKEILSQKRL